MAHTLPSGSSIDDFTMSAIRASGDDWREWLDEHMYSPADRDALDAMTRPTDPTNRARRVFDIPIPHDNESALAAMVALDGYALNTSNLLWHPEESAVDTITSAARDERGNFTYLFTREQAAYAQRVMDAVWEHLDDERGPCGVALDLYHAAVERAENGE